MKVLINFIQDRSGSMQSVWSETLSGFRAFLKELREKKDSVDYMFSLTTFDTLIDTPVVAVPLDKVDDEILAKHGPRGSTALYDAVGTTIKNTDDNLHGAEKVICVIVTDGHENSSREWTKDSLHKSVDDHLNKGNWTFTYLGTQPETWDDAQLIAVPSAASATYNPHTARASYAALARSVSKLASDKHVMGSRSMMSDYLSDAEAVAAGIVKKPTAPPNTSPAGEQ